ncbi:hypothetical protein MVT47_25665, partial [Salmonella sp. L-S2618]|nr:hypothetical protein [Salmonella sp. L-S2618]
MEAQVCGRGEIARTASGKLALAQIGESRGSAVAMINTMTSYKLISSNLTRSLTRVAAEPVVQRDTDYYLKNIGKVKTIDDFMKDDRLYKYALKA